MTATVNEQATATVRGACPHDCPDTCAMLVSVRDGRAVEVRGDPEHPFTRGGLCVKVNNYVDKAYSPDRVLYPMRRTGPKAAVSSPGFPGTRRWMRSPAGSGPRSPSTAPKQSCR
jgi:anaerobic selenocysteine-containing dehydrogenase